MPYFTTPEAAERLQVSPAYLRRLILDGRIRAKKLPGGKGGSVHVIEERELDAFAASRRPRGRPRKRKD